MPMFWGVTPYLVPFVDNLEGMLANIEEAIVNQSTVQPGQQVVMICGFPVGAKCPPNLALLYTVGTMKKGEK
jgi:pyruvate kinase